MKKWNLYGWTAVAALSGTLFMAGGSNEVKAQEFGTNEVCKTELEWETQEQAQLEEQTEAETLEQTQLEEQTEAETQEQTQSEMQEYMQYETETGLELLEEAPSQEPTEAVPDNFFYNSTSAMYYLREQMVMRQTAIEFVVMLDYELSDDELDELSNTLMQDAMAHSGSSREGDALIGDFAGGTVQVSALPDIGYGSYLFEYDMNYCTDWYQENELYAAIESKTDELCLNATTDYEIVRRVYDYICSNVKYDTISSEEYLLQYSAYAAMIQHKAVCQGYSTLFYRMCMEAGIPVRVVSGTANGEPHEWNIVQVNGNWYNVDTTWDAYDSELTRNYQWFLKSDKDFSDHVADNEWWNPSEASYARAAVSYDVPETDRCFVGLAYVNGVWYYYRNGGVDNSFSGLVFYNGSYYYVEKGTINWNYTGLVLDKGIWRFVRGGCLDESYTGLTQYYGTWYYVQNGALNWGYTGLANYNGSWFAIENGRLNWNYNGLMLYRGAWYYISGGCLDWNYTGLTNYYGTWYYIYKGCLNWGYTGLVYYNSAWYYVESGVMNWGYTGLTLYKGCWYYVEGSIIRWNYTGLVEYYGKKYYVEKSAINWNYTGSFVQDGQEYQVYYGTVVG